MLETIFIDVISKTRRKIKPLRSNLYIFDPFALFFFLVIFNCFLVFEWEKKSLGCVEVYIIQEEENVYIMGLTCAAKEEKISMPSLFRLIYNTSKYQRFVWL